MNTQSAALITNCCRSGFILFVIPHLSTQISTQEKPVFSCSAAPQTRELRTSKQSYVTCQGAKDGAKILQSILEASLKLCWVNNSELLLRRCLSCCLRVGCHVFL